MSGRNEGRIITEEKTEVGDVAKSLMKLLDSQYASTRFEDVLTSTRLNEFQIQAVSLGNTNRMIAKIWSMSEEDLEDDTLSEEEQSELKELWAIKKRMMKNPMTISYVAWDTWLRSFIMGMQSLGGGSRFEGVEIASGSVKRLMSPEELSLSQKVKKLLGGNVMYR
jgi:hypothetical protein